MCSAQYSVAKITSLNHYLTKQLNLKKESSHGEPAPHNSCSIRANYNYTNETPV